MRMFCATLIKAFIACIVAGTIFALLTQASPAAYYHLVGMQTNWGSTFERTQEWSSLNKKEISILFFGSSTCYSSIDPAFCSDYGKTGFSFCSPGSNTGNSLHILSNIMDSLPNLETVVLDVYPSNWSNAFVTTESTRDFIINNASTEIDMIAAGHDMALKTMDPYTIVISQLLPRLKKLGILSHHASSDSRGNYRSGGFVYRTTPPLTNAPYCPSDSTTVRIFTFCEQFQDFVSMCSKNGTQLILVKPPELCNREYQIPSCWEDIPFIDGDLWPESKNYKYFRDDHHMVGQGAEIYSRWLVEQLSEIW